MNEVTRRHPQAPLAQTLLLVYLALFAYRAKDAGALKAAAMDSRMLSALIDNFN